MRGLDRVPRQSERPREHARAAAGEEAERHVGHDAVEHLVVRAVTAEHVDRCRLAGLAGDLRRLTGRRGEASLGSLRKRRLHGSEPMLVHTGRERIDDQKGAHLGVA